MIGVFRSHRRGSGRRATRNCRSRAIATVSVPSGSGGIIELVDAGSELGSSIHCLLNLEPLGNVECISARERGKSYDSRHEAEMEVLGPHLDLE